MNVEGNDVRPRSSYRSECFSSVAREPKSTGSFSVARFGSRLALYFVHLYWTVLVIALVGFIILFRIILSYAPAMHRHPPDFRDVTINKRPQLTLVGNYGPLSSVAFSPDGKRIAAGATMLLPDEAELRKKKYALPTTI